MSLAIGNSSSGKDRGYRVYDVRDFGAISRPSYDATSAAINTVAFQLAYDTAIAGLDAIGYATVYIPAGNWFLSAPIFMDGNKVGFKGEGPGLSNLCNATFADIFILGLPRKPGGVAVSSDHFPDAWTGGPGGTRVYDSTAVTAAGQRWGLRTKADSHLSQQGGPLDRGTGDGYRTTRKLTVSVYVDLTLSRTTVPPGRVTPLFPTSGAFMGMIVGVQGVPWMLAVNNSNLQLFFRTVDVNGLNPVDRSAVVYQVPGSPGLLKLDIQIDLQNAQISVYVNGVQTSVIMAGIGAGFTAAAGLYFSYNENNPFGLAATSESIQGTGTSVGGDVDYTFWGLRLVADLLYTNRNTAGTNNNAGAGTTQTRIDGATITDLNRYFTWEANTICLLTLQDSPAKIASNRLISVATRVDFSPTFAFFCDNALSGNPNFSATAGPIEGLELICSNANYGRCIAICVPNEVRVSYCRLFGGHQAVGAINASSNYPHNYDHCYMSGTDACLYTHNALLVHISHCSFSNGVVMLRFYGSDVEIEHCFINGGGAPDYNVWSKNGSGLKISHLYQDSESPDGGPTKAMIYISGNNGGNIGGLGSNVHLEFFGGGRQLGGSAQVILEDGAPEEGSINRSCRFLMTSHSSEDNSSTAVLRNNGKRWRGTLIAATTPQRPIWVQNLDPSGQGNVISLHDHFTGPPRDGTWGWNAHILKVPTPALSQFTEWRCLSTGSYGTAAPPTWYGMNPIDDGLSLAAYLQDNTYWSAPSIPATGQGFWANGTTSLFLNTLFGGTMPTTPANLYVGCAARIAIRTPQVIEMGGANGYARVPTGPWTLAAAGATNTNTITFPTATADWNLFGYYNVINSLLFYDALAGGNYLAAVDVPPTTILSGQTLSYAPGAFTIARAPSPLGSFADLVHAKMNGLWLNQTPFTVPTIYLALSTAPASLAAPTEPSVGSYARVATSGVSWARNSQAVYNMTGALSSTGSLSNATALTFPTPTASWGTAQSVYLMDAPSGGNVLGSANLAIPRTILSGSPARSFAVGALWISLS